MSIRQTLQERELGLPRAGLADPASTLDPALQQEIVAELHRRLLERVDLDALSRLLPDRLREELRVQLEKLILESGMALNAIERKQVIVDVQNEVLGYGPLEPLLADPTVSDILVNTHKTVYVERRGKLELTPVRFANDQHLLKIIDKIVSKVGRRVDESSPMVDARLPDGSRVNAIIPPLAIDGPSMSIRRFAVVPLRMDDLLRHKSLTPNVSELLGWMVKARLSLLISGGTGSGKTTLLNILSSYIGQTERVVTIEDAAELQLQQPHVVRLETRPPNIEGNGEVTQRALVRNSLRMRPDRIVIGEVRGAEAFDMLQAMNTGHEGSMSTIHANTPRDGLSRMESMLGMASMGMTLKAMRQQISSAIAAIVQVSRLADGKRKITHVCEITGMEGEVITIQDIFVFQQTGIGKDGEVEGHFRATGVRPKFLDRMKAHGAQLTDDLFDPNRTFQ
jgi:pilus assembly protein CpaF